MFNLSDRASFICRMVRTPVIVILLLTVFMSGNVLALSAGLDNVTVTVFNDGRRLETTTVLDTAEGIMGSLKIVPAQNEKYELHKLSTGLTLLVGQPFSVEIKKNGSTHFGTIPAGSVAVALELMGITLDENDAVSLPLDTLLDSNTEISVVSVEKRTETVEQELAFETDYIETDALSEGKTLVEQDGACGLAQITYSVSYHDGEEISREVVSEQIISEPVNKKVLCGTADNASKAVTKSSSGATTNQAVNDELVSPLSMSTPIEVDAAGYPVHYKGCITAVATAYSPEDGNTTATGEPAQLGYIAVNPRQIPYGTMMYIRTADGSYIYGVAKAADTGGFISDSTVKVDLFFGSASSARQFGRRNVEIYFI